MLLPRVELIVKINIKHFNLFYEGGIYEHEERNIKTFISLFFSLQIIKYYFTKLVKIPHSFASSDSIRKRYSYITVTREELIKEHM